MSFITMIRSFLYGSAKTLGDVSAVKNGHIVKRIKFRFFGKLASRLLQKLLK